MKLAILTAGYLLPDMKDKIERSDFMKSEIDFDIFDYKNFTFISELYRQICDDYDGFLVSGLAACCALEKGINGPLKPTVVLDTDLESVYHALLELILKDRKIDFNRVLIDVLLPQDPQMTAAALLHLKEPGFAKTNSETFWRTRSLEELKEVEEQVYNLIIKKWEQGEVDYVLSRYSTLIPRLEKKGIPCSFIYPTSFNLSNTIKECADAVSLTGMREHMPGVIAVFKGCGNTMELCSQDMDIDILALQKALLEFNKEYLTDYQLQKHLNGFYIFTNLKTINRITRHLSSCSLSAFLKEHLSFQTDVAYGFAKDIGQAKTNASAALKASMLDHHVYAVNESATLIGPLDLNSGLPPVCDLTPELEQIARRSRLSPLTVQRLKAIADTSGSSEITIAELAEKLGVKQRNANRILTNMLQSGDAVISGARASGTKGRPTKVYKLTAFSTEHCSYEAVKKQL